MIKFVGVASALIFALDAVPAARAQVMLDVSKITCEQFAGYKITTPQNVAIWLSGYYNGKRGNTVIDMQKLLADTKTMERYCIQNPQVLFMKAVETVLGVNKWGQMRSWRPPLPRAPFSSAAWRKPFCAAPVTELLPLGPLATCPRKRTADLADLISTRP